MTGFRSSDAVLTLVTAPAGWGKTTLLSHFEQIVDGPVRWLRIDPGDAEVERLCARIDSVATAVEQWGMAKTDSVSGSPSDVNCLTVRPGRSLLLVDDSHLIDGSGAEWVLLERAHQLVARGVNVAIAGRRSPELGLPRYESPEINLVGAEDLRFRAWEVERLFREVYQEPLPADDIATLARRLGGWAAGLQLYHLSTRGRPLAERQRAVASLGGRSTVARAYLTRTVLAELPDQLRRFLARTCVFDVLTGARCDQLLATTGGQRALEQLERHQAFTVTYDGGGTYRYHEVLRAHLLAGLIEELGEAGARSWHIRAAEILAAEGAPLEAARCYARAEDWPAVQRLLDDVGAGLAAQSLDPWYDLLPDWFIAEDPWLLLAQARQRVSNGQLAEGLAILHRAERMSSAGPARTRCQALLTNVAAWLSEGAPGRGHWSGWLRAATQRHPTVVAAEAGRLSTPEATLVRMVSALLGGNLMEVGRQLDRGPAAVDDDLFGLVDRLLRAVRAAAVGDRRGVVELIALAGRAESCQLPWLSRLARAATAVSGEEPYLKEALAVADECARVGDRWGACLAGLIGALVRVGTGPLEPAETAGLTLTAHQLPSGVLQAWAQALHAVAAVGAQLPDADEEVRRAESTARSAGVAGARVLAMVAGLRLRPHRPRQLDAVHAAAGQAGLPRTLVTAWLAGIDDDRIDDGGTGSGGGAGGVTGAGGGTSVAGGVTGQVPAGTGPVRTGPARPAASRDGVLAVYCFGAFRLTVDDVAVDWSPIRPRARAVARMLALNAGRAVHRDVLLDALWPDTGRAAATRNLHVTLSSLRRFLTEQVPAGGPDRLLHRDGDAYLLALPPGSYCDILAFRAAVQQARRLTGPDRQAEQAVALRTMVATYRGELLPEDGPAEWVVGERESLRRQAADAAAMLARAELKAAESLAAAIDLANQCVEIDPCHDLGWRVLIAAHDRAGNVAAAERARRAYSRVLRSLDLDPESIIAARRIPLPRSPRSVPTPDRRSSG